MADDPGRDDKHPEDSGPEENPLEELLRQLGITGAPGAGSPDLAALMQQLQQAFGQMFSAGSPGPTAGYAGFANPAGPGGAAAGQPGQLDWRQVSTAARKVCAERGDDPAPSREQRENVTETARIADAWLDRSTSFPATEEAPKVWSRSEWLTSTLPVWERIISPVATSFADALADALLQTPGEEGPAPELAQMAGMLKPMLRTSGAMMYGTTVAEALGRLACEVLGLTDIGLPLGDGGAVVLIPANVEAFSEGLDQSDTDIRVYLALREAARQRLFAAAPWLRPQLLSLFEQYAARIRNDMSAMEDIYRDLDPAAKNLEGMQEAFEKIQGSLFEPVRTPEQQSVLDRLETLLALIEGWVDETVTQATAAWMPAAPALAETLHRRSRRGGVERPGRTGAAAPPDARRRQPVGGHPRGAWCRGARRPVGPPGQPADRGGAGRSAGLRRRRGRCPSHPRGRPGGVRPRRRTGATPRAGGGGTRRGVKTGCVRLVPLRSGVPLDDTPGVHKVNPAERSGNADVSTRLPHSLHRFVHSSWTTPAKRTGRKRRTCLTTR